MRATVREPVRSLGVFFHLSIDTFRGIATWPFQHREFLDQCWFIVRVSLVPTLLVALPFTALISFTFNILAAEFGASDVAGAGATLGAVTQVGPVVTVLVVAGAGATAICADLGSRTIREEIDALEVLGIDPIVRLVAPRVLASTVVAVLLNALVCAIGIAGGFFFSGYFQNVTPGAFVDGIPLLTGVPELVISEIKAGAFGLIAGLIACYRGLTVKGGPKGVGHAANETVDLGEFADTAPVRRYDTVDSVDRTRPLVGQWSTGEPWPSFGLIANSPVTSPIIDRLIVAVQ